MKGLIPFNWLIPILLLFSFFNGQGQISDVVKERLLIRKLYLEELGKPPTPKEMEWLMVYSLDSYVTAVEWVLNLKYKEDFISKRNYFLSNSYKNSTPLPMSSDMCDKILIYQSGCRDNSIKNAKEILISNAITMSLDGTDPIDYMFECLTGRITNAKEANHFIEIYKKHSSEKESLRAVLEEMLKAKDFLFK